MEDSWKGFRVIYINWARSERQVWNQQRTRTGKTKRGFETHLQNELIIGVKCSRQIEKRETEVCLNELSVLCDNIQVKIRMFSDDLVLQGSDSN